MRLSVVVVVTWLTIGVIALIQHGCLSGSSSNLRQSQQHRRHGRGRPTQLSASTPKIKCTTPQPSK
jgi:hypothetical protein